MKNKAPITLLYKAPVATKTVAITKLKKWVLFAKAKVSKSKDQSLSGESSTILLKGRGPATRFRNLLKGLKQANIPYRLQPSEGAVSKNVGVLSNVEALKWAIAAKRAGKIQTLVAGPNLVVFPSDHNGIICSKEIDVIVTASKWVSNYWGEMAPELKLKLVEWPVGVDTDYWKPVQENIRSHILIYDKRGIYFPHLWPPLHEEKVLIRKLFELLEETGQTILHVAYGSYSPETYKEKLQQSKGAVFLSRSETQGHAMFEAWSMNVPTLIWSPGKFNSAGVVLETSSCPYLEKRNGISFEKVDDLEISLRIFLEQLHTYSPRDVVREKYELKQTAINYANLFLMGINP